MVLPFLYTPTTSQSLSLPTSGDPSQETIASYTVVLAIFNGLLVLVTGGLVWVGWRQARLTEEIANRQTRDTEILQRAYLSVEAGGLHPVLGRPEGQHVVIGHVHIRRRPFTRPKYDMIH